MATEKPKPRALYLTKDGRTELFSPENVEGAKADGWAEPTNNRANGEPYNPPIREGAPLPASEFAAQTNAATAEVNAKLAKEDNDAAVARQAEIDANRVPLDERPDLRVEVVNSDATTTSKSAPAKKSTK